MQWPDGSIGQDAFNAILDLVPKGGTVLELGSGFSTGELIKYYTVYSVEQDSQWLNHYHSNYIYAPIVNGWYDTKVLNTELPTQYDLLIIDGPAAKGVHPLIRLGLLKNIKLFNLNAYIMVHDVNRRAEHKLATKLGRIVNRPVKFKSNTKFVVI
jgi:hypothetical protein